VIKNHKFDVIYSSPFRRCWQTACLIAVRTGINVIHIDFDLREKSSAIKKCVDDENKGKSGGFAKIPTISTPRDQKKEFTMLNDEFKAFCEDKLKFNLIGFELNLAYVESTIPSEEIDRRTEAVVKKLADPNRNVLIVSHGDLVGEYFKILNPKQMVYEAKYCSYVLSSRGKMLSDIDPNTGLVVDTGLITGNLIRF
jgi:phosphohistidine phosphatase SixA